MATTPRRANRFPVGTDSADIPLWAERLALDLDNHAKDDQGLLSARPAAGALGGKRGDYWFATDEGRLYRSDGAAWNQIILAGDSRLVTNDSVGYAQLAKDGAGPGVGAFQAVQSYDVEYVVGASWQAVSGAMVEDYDLSSWVADGRFTPQVKGLYFFHATVVYASGLTDQMLMGAGVVKNGALHNRPVYPRASGAGAQGTSMSVLIAANGTTDYFYLGAYFGGAASITIGATGTFWGGHLVARQT